MITAAIAAGPSPAGPASAGTGRPVGIPTALTPGGAQAVFRATLDVLARPGTVKRLPSAADEPLAAHVPAALLPLLALADLSTPACVAGHEEGAWDEIVRVATNAPRTALSDARLVTALRPLTADELGGLRTGTAAAPEDGALACLAVSGIAIVDGADTADVAGVRDRADGSGGGGSDGDGGDATGDGGRLWLRLSGPGVPGTRAVIVTGLPAGFAAARRRLVAGFPAGADLLLIAPDGAMTGLPRTTTLHEEAS
jgi:alpha-D-ribose 1-methylphosphonate 5-triphosphate synthase subunit PhnH